MLVGCACSLHAMVTRSMSVWEEYRLNLIMYHFIIFRAPSLVLGTESMTSCVLRTHSTTEKHYQLLILKVLSYILDRLIFLKAVQRSTHLLSLDEKAQAERGSNSLPQISQSASGRHKFIPGLFFRTQNSQLYLGSENKEPFYVNAIYIEIGFIPQNVPYLESVAKNKLE